ncbi:MAG: hypothetical protein KA521_11810, partial [Crocinitomicaceae bacterium]|nr:hypothetical protein [Crocinitomicaceae bacterium]
SNISFALISLSGYADCLGTIEMLWSLIINCLLMKVVSSNGYTQRTGLGVVGVFEKRPPGTEVQLKYEVEVNN